MFEGKALFITFLLQSAAQCQLTHWIGLTKENQSCLISLFFSDLITFTLQLIDYNGIIYFKSVGIFSFENCIFYSNSLVPSGWFLIYSSTFPMRWQIHNHVAGNGHGFELNIPLRIISLRLDDLVEEQLYNLT